MSKGRSENENRACESICEVLKCAYGRNWISTRDGNASFRSLNEQSFFITPTGVRKYNLIANEILQLNLPDLGCVNSNTLKPSGEIHLHHLLQKNIDKDRAVLHLHPTYVIAGMHANINLQKLANEFPEINRYTKVGPTVPVLPPITKDLAEASVKALNLNREGKVDYNIIGLDKHGVIAVDRDVWSAFEHCERLEHICQVVLASGNYKHLMN